ncbi:MAG: hypothetical protein BGP06_08075 [Rhizobiales bacterium 65-9]|nr:hypothetical protein [Hyphomicrobiales bacterium]OJY33888.1 MAG: hypothetical protein BGP06_08075 [Rhizobiales bacterium 65-9]
MLKRVVAFFLLSLAPAMAQQTDAPAAPPAVSEQQQPAEATQTPVAPAVPAPPVPAPAEAAPPQAAAPVKPDARGLLFLTAQFAITNKTIASGLTWRVFPEIDNAASEQPVAISTEPAPAFQLEPGPYIVHVAYGLASAVRRITVGGRETNERVTIAAGGLRLSGAIGQTPLQPAQVTFTIYAPLPNNSEGRLVAQNVKGGDLVRLPEGAYHVVSAYGDTNAITRADLKVESGTLTEATMNHRAATVTLKLVSNPGGEALAGTAFSVLTPGGDIIREAIGAFPSLILAEGEYICIARHQGKVYQRPFKVESGLDRDIEVLAR